MTDWKQMGACRGEDGETFYPVGYGPAAAPDIARAKAICARCPVSEECLKEALDTGDRFGIWGGKTPDERLLLRCRARRARAA